MFKQLLLASTLSLGLVAAPSAMAGKYDHSRGHDRGHGRVEVVKHGDDRKESRGKGTHHVHRQAERGWQHQREHRWNGPRLRAAPYQPPRGFYRHSWRAGERLPHGYRASRHVVNDYRHYHLYAPPRGHHWVRVDRDVVLTAIATGVVAAVVYDLFGS